MTTQHDLIVVGEGYAGLTCAAEAARLGLKVATFEAEFFGGLVLNVNELHNFDEGGGLSGMDYAAVLAKSNAKAGVRSTNTAVTAIRQVGDAFEVATDEGTQTARAVVIATGARLKQLGVPGEEDFDGRGVSHCADCDAPMYTDATVVVAGGNDWALHEALVLAQDAAAVVLVHAGTQPEAGAESLEHVRREPKIRCVPNAVIARIVGNDGGVNAVQVRDDSGTHEIACAGVFPFIGLQPNSEIAPAQVPRDDNGALEVDSDLQTCVHNLFAIGNVRAGFGGWLADALGDARRAAQAAKARLG